MHRGWQDDPAFRNEPHSRRSAWVWLIENAAWEDHFQWFNGHRIEIKRGQLATSERELSEAWKWDRQRVRTFLRQLETDEKLTRETARTATKLTICNYTKYQDREPTEQPTANPELTQDQPTTEEGKELKEENLMPENSGEYAFFGQTIKLAPRHLSEWKRLFHTILDLEAELSVLDGWWQAQPEAKRSNWFLPTKGMLNKKHQANLKADEQARAPPAWDGFA